MSEREPFIPAPFFPAGSSSEDTPAPQGFVAHTKHEADYLKGMGWIDSTEFYRSRREREAEEKTAAAKAAEEATRRAAEEEKRAKAAREKEAAEAKALAEAEAAAAKRAKEQEERDAFLVGVYHATVRPLEDRRSWIHDKLRNVAQNLAGGWDSDLATEGLELHEELDAIRVAVAAAEQQLADAREAERKKNG